MATLGGDLIRMLAHGGISTLGNVGAQFLGDYFKERAQEKLLGLKTNIEAAGVESDPDVQQQILRQLPERLGLAKIQESGMAPRGETPTMENLGVRKGLTYPEAGYVPATVERIVAPVPSLEALKTKAAMGIPDAKTRLDTLYPKERALETALITKGMDIEARAREGDLNRGNQLTIAQMIDASREATRAQTLQHQQTVESLQRDKLDQQRKAFGLVAKKVGDQSVIKHSSDINSAWDDYQRAASAKKPDPNLVAAAAEKYNKNIELAEKMVPELAGHFTPLTPEMTEAWGWFGLAEPKPIPTGKFISAPKGGAPKAAVVSTVVAPTTPTLSDIQEEKRRRGLIK